MNYFDEQTTISFDDKNNQELIEKQLYQDYLRNNGLTNNNSKIAHYRIQKILENPKLYLAIKQLPKLEKDVFCLAILRNQNLKNICSLLKISKSQAIETKNLALKHFIENVQKIQTNNNTVDTENE